MSREKQIGNCKKYNSHEEKKIKEMAKDLCDIIVWTDLDGEPLIDAEQTCAALYDIGYRKQSEGEWLVDAWDNEKEEWVTIPYNKHLHADAFCSLCKEHALLDGKEYGVASNYCPNCGAKMKGGAE